MGKDIQIKITGRPTKFKKDTTRRVINYINDCLKNKEFPTKQEIALILGVTTVTFIEWSRLYEDFSYAMAALKDAQELLLSTEGLSGKFNARIATLLLKADHNKQEAPDTLHATQTNIFQGLSPELLAEAMELSKLKRSKPESDEDSDA